MKGILNLCRCLDKVVSNNFVNEVKVVVYEFGRRWVSNATRHPSHLRKRFTVRTNELWAEVDSVFQGYKHVEGEKDVLMKERTGRTLLASMTILYQKYQKGNFSTDTNHLLCGTLSQLNEGDEVSINAIRPREKHQKAKEMKSSLNKVVEPIKSEIVSNKYKQAESIMLDMQILGKRAIHEIKQSHESFETWLEYPQFCHLLYRIGKVAYNFEDKEWIFDAYKPFIRSLASQIPPELELLSANQLLNVFYGLACLGPQVLGLDLEQHSKFCSTEDLMQALRNRALEIVDDLNGNHRCELIEGTILIGRRLNPKQLTLLLNDAYPLLKIKYGDGVVKSTKIATLLWSMGHHKKCVDKWKIGYTFLIEMRDARRFRRLKAADMCRAVYGLGQLAIKTDNEDFLEKVTKYFQFNVDLNERQMYNEQAVEFAEGLALLKPQSGSLEVLEYLLKDLTKRVTPLSDDQRTRFLKACLALGYPMKSSLKKAILLQ